MENLETLSARDISRDIMMKFGESEVRNVPDRKPDENQTVWCTRSKSKLKTLSEISDLVTKRRKAFVKTGDIYRQLLGVRTADNSKLKTPKWASSQKERPLSEFTLRNDWKKRDWDVTPIHKPNAPPNSPKSTLAPMETVKLNSIPTKEENSQEKKDGEKTDLKVQDGFSKKAVLPSIKTDSDKKRSSKTDKRKTMLTEKGTAPCSPRKRSRERSSSSDFGNMTWTSGVTTTSKLSEPGWGSRTLDKRFLEQAARELIELQDEVRETISRCYTKIQYIIT